MLITALASGGPSKPPQGGFVVLEDDFGQRALILSERRIGVKMARQNSPDP
jgi:hypothetical protein